VLSKITKKRGKREKGDETGEKKGASRGNTHIKKTPGRKSSRTPGSEIFKIVENKKDD